MKHLLVLFAAFSPIAVSAADPKPVPDAEFNSVLKMIRKQPEEWTWSEVPWLIQFSDAQKIAASEGKPILVATAAQGSLCGYL